MPDKHEMLEGLVKGLLGGVGDQIYSATDRERRMTDEGRQAEIQYWTSQLPRVREDPQAQQDILGRIFDLHGAHAKSGGKMSTDLHKTLMPAQDFIKSIYGKVYKSGEGTPGTPDATLGESDAALSGIPDLVGKSMPGTGTPEVPDRLGPFVTPEEMQDRALRLKQKESDITEGRTVDINAKRAAAASAEKIAAMQAEQQAKIDMFEKLQKPALGPNGEIIHPGYSTRDAAGIMGMNLHEAPDHPETRVIITTNDGRKLEGWQDAYGHKFTDLNQQTIDPTTIKEVNPKTETNANEVRDLAFASFREKNKIPEGQELTATQKVAAVKDYNLATNVAAQTSININQSETDTDLRSQAELALITGKDPSFGLSANNPTRQRYNTIKAQLIAEKGGAGEAAAQGADFAAGKANYTKLLGLRGQMKAAENGTVQEINRLVTLSKLVPRSEIRAFNTLDQFLTAQLTPGTALARYREALVAARSRYNSMISSLRGGGSATNMVRAETAEEIINKAMSEGTLEAAADEMKVGIKNVMKGIDQAVDETRKGLSDIGKPKKEEPTPDTDTTTEPVEQKNKKTGAYRYSLDGGATWKDGRAPQKAAK